MRVLLVERNVEMVRLLKSMLAEVAEEVFDSPGETEAVTLFHELRPDWVVMDVFRKPANGLTAAAAIRAVAPEAKIIFISNYTDERTRRMAEEAGGETFFGKDDLLSLVEFLKTEKGKL